MHIVRSLKMCVWRFVFGDDKKMKKHYFTKAETALWCASVLLITAAFLLFDRGNYLTLAASLVGVTSLIFSAKGNPVGQALIIIFSVLYGIISFNFAYYGEMITYLGMTAPMSVFALISSEKSLRREPRGGQSEPYPPPRGRLDVRAVGGRDGRVLLYP